jgi:hypothetical protein
MAENQNPGTETQATEVLFRRIIIISTELSLAGMYGWLACFDRQLSGDVFFHWRWIGLVWAGIGYGSCWYFWHKIWPASETVTATRGDILKGSAVLAVPCLWWITFPLRFLSGQHFWDVLAGLVAAATVLSFGAWMMTRLIKAFERSDKEDLNALDSGADATAEAEADSSKKTAE